MLAKWSIITCPIYCCASAKAQRMPRMPHHPNIIQLYKHTTQDAETVTTYVEKKLGSQTCRAHLHHTRCGTLRACQQTLKALNNSYHHRKWIIQHNVLRVPLP